MDEWTGRRAALLRRALRLTNERFAELLGTAVRTVAKWNAVPDIVPMPDLQRALDLVLARAPEDARERFTLLAGGEEPVAARPQLVATDNHRLDHDPGLTAAFDWLDLAIDAAPGTARSRVEATLAGFADAGTRANGSRAGQDLVVKALEAYYGSDGNGLYRARTPAGLLRTSILTRPAWLDLGRPVGADHDDLRLKGTQLAAQGLTAVGYDAALARLAGVITHDTTLVNAPIYRLTSIDIDSTGIGGRVAQARFVDYALTMDLLEHELSDALRAGLPTTRGTLPLRDHYLPDVDAVLNIGARLCAGGALALTAIARPPSRRHDGDYLLLVQERSARVLNSSRRLAVIPKAFHGPLNDLADDAPIGATLERELEEELFGRSDVDSTTTGPRHAAPMHTSRLSAPMAWLREHQDGEHWRMECTGFGFNLVSGNYEFASLVVIEDDEWWARFGGYIEANWETDELRRYSSRDPQVLDTLAHDPAWSNEGLFALLQGFRRLRDVGGRRVDLPEVELEL